MSRDYIKIKKPVQPFPISTNILRELNDDFWKGWIFFHLLSFYKNYDSKLLRKNIEAEQKKSKPRTERIIAMFVRKTLKNSPLFDSNFDVIGESTNDEKIEGNYDIVISNTYWKNQFYFECKNLNLDSKKSLTSKYIYYDRGRKNYDGGVYRYFNEKYAQHQDFGGMIGFVLDGDIQKIKSKIIEKLKTKFDTSPDGDFIRVVNNSIDNNDFTFDSIHFRFSKEFVIHHILFDFNFQINENIISNR